MNPDLNAVVAYERVQDLRRRADAARTVRRPVRRRARGSAVTERSA